MRNFTIPPVAFFLFAVFANLTLVARLLTRVDVITSRSDADDAEKNQPERLQTSTLRPIVPKSSLTQSSQPEKDSGISSNATAAPQTSDDDYLHITFTGPQSQDGVSRDHIGKDGEWIENLPAMLGCPHMEDNFENSDNPLSFNNTPTKESHWNKYYIAYHATVDPGFRKLPFEEYQQNAWSVPIEVKFSPVNGRGVYAKERIPKDTLVWDSNSNSAEFANSHEYRHFLEYLIADPNSLDAACGTETWYDVISKPDHLYSQSKDKEEFVICQTFDEGALFNEDMTPEKSKINLNAKPTKAFNACGGYTYVASRDIQPGEELIINYDVDQLMNNGYVAMGLEIYDPHKQANNSGHNINNATIRASQNKALKPLAPQNTTLNQSRDKKSIGEKASSYDTQSQDGISRDHMGRDGDWAQDLPELLGCPSISSDFAKSEDPMAYNYIPNKDTHWNHFIKAYHATIDPHHTIIPYEQYNQSAWSVPIEVKFSKVDGRGVYAKELIPKGARVWDADYHTAVFNTSHAYRKFLEYMIADNTTKKAACDCQIWIDVAPKPKDSDDDTIKRHKRKEFQICQTFDEAVLFNARDQSKINLESVESASSNPCGRYYYITTRDIQAGEQLFIDYSDGSGGSTGWRALGMM